MGERPLEVDHQFSDGRATHARCVQRIVRDYLRRGDVVDDRQVDIVAAALLAKGSLLEQLIEERGFYSTVATG